MKILIRAFAASLGAGDDMLLGRLGDDVLIGGRAGHPRRHPQATPEVIQDFTAPAATGPNDPYSARQKVMTEGVRLSLDGFSSTCPNRFARRCSQS
ncbi:hypothetical protein AYO39_02495 [Actinobacteria bacterium SCGC AG-212-D09]|nr:hypothetical protein AYO39_02495 [Actinobacteria bacterium SCGC AG-212-D09]